MTRGHALLRRLQAHAWFALAFLFVLEAEACPVCFSAKNEASRWAFIWSTVFMTVFPLVIILGTIYWFVRKERERDALELAQTQNAPLSSLDDVSHKGEPAR